MESYRSLLERYVELYNAGDLDGVMDLYAEDSVQLMPDGTFEGRSAIHDRLAKELAAFADIAHRYVSYIEQGDAFADEWVFVGTHTGPLVLPDGTELTSDRQTRGGEGHGVGASPGRQDRGRQPVLRQPRRRGLARSPPAKRSCNRLGEATVPTTKVMRVIYRGHVPKTV